MARVVRCSGAYSTLLALVLGSHRFHCINIELTEACLSFSGTIKKIQLAAIAYNRLIVSTVLDCARTETASKSSTSQAVAVSSGGTKGTSTASDRPQVVLAAPEGEGGWEGWRVKETDVIRSMTD